MTSERPNDPIAQRARDWIERFKATTYGDKGLRLQMEEAQELLSSLVASEDEGQKKEELLRAPASLSPAVEPLTHAAETEVDRG